MGEGAGSPQFTHVSTDDFRIVRDNLNGGNRTTRDRLIPFCIFTDPELARVGLNESQAQKQGIPYRLAKIPMAKVRRAHTLSETRGFLKALVSAETDEILGFTAFGTEAGEIMSVVQTAMLAKLPYTSLRDAILAHPTMVEGLTVLFDAVPARSTARTTLIGMKNGRDKPLHRVSIETCNDYHCFDSTHYRRNERYWPGGSQ